MSVFTIFGTNISSLIFNKQQIAQHF